VPIFDDLAQGAELFTDVKLIAIGNGEIGKTQICRKLAGEEFQQGDSTHGIVIRPVKKWPLNDVDSRAG
jgi:internalin A